jgi:UPF0271 protein
MEPLAIDLNSDVGEGAGDDAVIIPLVTSVNVACGFHAGDPATIRQTIRLAKRHGAAVGAHPSYPDREGFGRRPMARPTEAVEDDLLFQLGALQALCRAEGVELAHVKPHGALYNAAAEDPVLAAAIARAVVAFDPSLVVVCLAGSPMVEVVRRQGLACAQEAFADRGYTPRGTLVPRDQPGALVDEPAAVAERAWRMARHRTVLAVDGTEVGVAADTLCLHGDTPGAARLAAAVRSRLLSEGVRLRPLHSSRKTTADPSR